MQYIGLEVANGYIKVTNGNKTYCYENRLRELLGDEFNIFKKNETEYEYNGQKYVLDKNGISSAGRDQKRYSSEQYKLEALIAISKVCTSECAVMVGLPCRYFKKDSLHQDIKTNLEGTHILKINGEPKIITVKRVYVTCEPLGTLIDFAFNENLEQRRDLIDYRYLIVDIGHGTTDVLVSDGLNVLKMFTDDKGGMEITNNYLNLINKRYEKEGYEFTIKDVGIENATKFKKYDRNFDLHEELSKSKNMVVKQIHSFINQCGINEKDFDRVIYTGGGSLALETNLKLDSNTAIYYDAQLGNAKGFRKLCLMLEGVYNG